MEKLNGREYKIEVSIVPLSGDITSGSGYPGNGSASAFVVIHNSNIPCANDLLKMLGL